MTGRMSVDLLDRGMFARNDFWRVLAWLRDNDPVHWHADPGGGGFWVVSRYEDAVAVYGDSDTFSSRYGMRLDSNPDAVAAVSQRMLIVSDPPDHTQLKRVLSKAFTPAEMARVEHLVRGVVRDLLAAAVDAGEVEFLDVAARIPNNVVCSLMGIPTADWDWIRQVTTEAFEGADEETRTGAHGDIFLYFTELVAERREQPGPDLVSRITQDRRATDVPGEERPLTDEEIVFNCNGLLAGANETTRYVAAGGLLALAEHPDQWDAVRRAGPPAIPAAVEEVLRWAAPSMHAMRTAVRPGAVGGVRVAVGDRVTVWNVSANRDEAAFPAADRFRLDRSPNRHLTFGAGRHLCIGARLARLELAVVLEELIARVAHVEVVGTPTYTPSNFTWGLTSLPVRLHPS